MVLLDSPANLKEGNPSLDVVVGISSFGEESCGEHGRPSAYSRVAAFSGWIEQTTKNLEAEQSTNPQVSCLGQIQ